MSQIDPVAVAISTCDREPIHIPGTIQPFGSLIATDLALETITHVSDNLANHLPDNVLGHPVSQILTSQLIHDLRNSASSYTIKTQRQRLGHQELGGTLFDTSLHRSEDRLILELEFINSDESPTENAITRVQSMLGHLQGDMASDKMLQLAVTILRHTTQFGRVMAYRFLQDGSGEVIAESCASEYESFLGLRYPHSDVSQSAKDLALRMPVRALANVSTPQVKILNQETDQLPLDLSLAYLRGVSPIHVEYLTNMGVSASMTIAIVVQKKLWGFFACHHHSPKLLTADLRSSCELFSHLFSLNFQQVLASERLQTNKKISSTISHLLETPREAFNFIQSTDSLWQTLGSLMEADGLAVIEQQHIETSHDTPNKAFILDLIHQCQTESTTDIVPIEHLKQVVISSDQAKRGQSAGALIIRISDIEQLYLIFFRNEVASKIRWGGNPKNEIIEGPQGPRLQPRASFEEYIERVNGRCPPWTATNIETALRLRSGLLYLAISQLEGLEQEALKQQRQQDLLIAELNHRVKNILTLIRSITRQTKESATSVTDYTYTLEKRIAALSSAHDLVAGHGLEWPQLEELLKIEVRPYLAESKDRIKLSGPNVGLKADFVPTFVLVLHELVSNAAKYGALSVPGGQVKVMWHLDNGGLALSWQESNGPKVNPPKRNGFGRKLIENSIVYEFEGKATLNFASQGVEAKFWIPNELMLWNSQESSLEIAPEEPAPNKTLELGKARVLIVEDNMLIALEQEDMIRSLGFQEIDKVARVKAALELLNSKKYALGVLDIDLKKENSFPIAKELLNQEIPFLFTTGYDSKYNLPKELEKIIRLKKPVEPDLLRKAIDSILVNSEEPRKE